MKDAAPSHGIISLAILAMGGEGGGVLADWLVGRWLARGALRRWRYRLFHAGHSVDLGLVLLLLSGRDERRHAGRRPAHPGLPLAKYDRPGKSGFCKSPNDRNSEQWSEASWMSGPDARAGCEGWVRGPPVRMLRRRAALRLKWGSAT